MRMTQFSTSKTFSRTQTAVTIEVDNQAGPAFPSTTLSYFP
uniref:Uncharacterized protein n=1 Tax=Anguilla anguilla TaxID=7936 RepID=A0A0E9SKT3_ANGAN